MSSKRPPVFFTIAAIRHEPLKALADYIPKIQDALRKRGYTGQLQESKVAAVSSNGPLLWPDPLSKPTVTERRYTLFNSSRNSAFTFNDSGIFAYHTSAYTTRAALFEQVKLGLEVLDAQVQLQSITHVGVRMLDLIRPSDFGLTVKDFVKESLCGFSGISETNGWKQNISTLEQRFIHEDAEIVARLDWLPNGFGIRGDLMADINGHKLPEHLTNSPGVPHAILDIDSGTRSDAEPKDFTVAEVMDELVGHKNRISMLFNASITDAALESWGLA